MKTKREILEEIQRVSITINWALDIVGRKTKKCEIKDGLYGIDLLHAHVSALRWAVAELRE
jgi:hypothetical protein